MNFNKKAFTLSCKTFSSDSSQAKLTQPPAQSSQTKFRSRAAHSYGFTLAETSTRHSEETSVTEESLTRHPDAQKKSPLWGESGCAKRSEHTTVREGNNGDLNTLSRIRKIPAVSTTTTSPMP